MGASESLQAEYLTYRQAAQLVSVCPSTVRAWCRQGRIRRYGEGRLHRVRRDELLAFFRALGAPNDSATERAASILARRSA